MVHKIDIFHCHSFRDRNPSRREINNSLHACFNQIVGGALGTFWRSGDYSNFDFKLTDLLIQTARTYNLKASHFLADLEGVAVERTNENEAATPENTMAQKRPAQVSNSDQGDIPRPVNSQGLLDGCKQVLNVIPDSAHSEFAEVR